MSIPSYHLELETDVVVGALGAVIKLHDMMTYEHSERVASLAVAIGRELHLEPSALSVLAHASLLHDLGKLGISDTILLKPSSLTPPEWVIVRCHPGFGLEALDGIGSLEREKQVIFSHHERLDGSGYPRHLMADGISIEARIVAVADTYDALISDRPYRAGVDTAIVASARPPWTPTALMLWP